MIDSCGTIHYVSICELVYSTKFDILPNIYYVSLTTCRFRGLHFESHAISQTPHSGYVTLCYFNHCQHKNHVTMVYHVIDSKLQPLFTTHTVSQ